MFEDNDERPRTSGIRLMVVSRDIHALKGLPTIQLDPDHDNEINTDVQRFVQYRVRELYKVAGFTLELAAQVEETLLERSEGTFLWIGFVMNELMQKATCTELLETLEALPKGLPAIYGRILLEVDESKREVVGSILLWVALAFRPLTIHRLSGVIKLHVSTALDPERAIMDQLSLSKRLLRVQNGRVGLIHQSVRDYLLRGSLDSNPILETFRISPEKGHYRIAQICLDLVEKYCGRRLSSAEQQKIPMLDYAIRAWPHHARAAGVFADAVIDMSRPMFRKNSRFAQRWYQCRFDLEDEKIRKLTKLHIASAIGLDHWVRKLLAQKRWKPRVSLYLSKKNFQGYTALHLSAIWGYEKIAQILLDNGANANVQTSDGDVPLRPAVLLGRESVIPLLLQKGADINARDKDGNTPLVIACDMKNTKMVQLLVAHGASVDTVFIDLTLFRVAGETDAEEIAVTLIEHGAQIDVRDSLGWTPLMSASHNGNVGVMRKLLSHGADPNAHDDNHNTPLLFALSGDFEAITVPVLLEHGADVNQPDDEGLTAIMWAIIAKSIAILPVLIEHGADINHRDRRGRTPLMVAVQHNNAEAVEMLLRYDVGVQTTTRSRRAARETAAELGFHEAVQLLNDHEKKLQESATIIEI
ncbi:ankyrin repeat domain-containing protein [Aspergillus undulatus]|uniref:ankyrin repeat domain-containing protein n=1 Tax=Aspergillus undulatus TaxID=1810928 RepID=UPI003CCE186A